MGLSTVWMKAPAWWWPRPGAEPVARGGYSGVLLLDGAATSQRAELGSGAKALRHWSNAVALVRPGGRAMLVGDPEPVSAQALFTLGPVWLCHA